MAKVIRRFSTFVALTFIAIKGFLAFLTLIKESDESQNIWEDEDELEEV